MMARAPSYYEQYEHAQPSSLGSYNNFPGSFVTTQSSFPIAASNSINSSSCSAGYSQAYSYVATSSIQAEDQNGYPCQYEFSSLVQRDCSQADTGSCGSFFSDDTPMGHNGADRHMTKEESQLSGLLSSNELDAHLSDLPLESLLHLTQPEERLIKENVVEKECIPPDCNEQIFKEDEDISNRLPLHRSHSPSGPSLYSSLSTSPASCSPQSSPFSPQSTSCSSQATSFSPQAAPYLPQTPTTSTNSPTQPSHQSMDNPLGNQPMLHFNKEDESNMNSFFAKVLEESPTMTLRTKKMAKPDAVKPSLTVTKRQLKTQKTPRKKTSNSVNPSEFAGSLCHNDVRKVAKTGYLDAAQHMDSSSSETMSTLDGKETANSPGGNLFVPPIQKPVEAKKPPPPRKRMKSSALSPEEKICGVCGDVAKNMHFGGMACDSCKAFFRRSVQSATWENFRCEQEDRCVISKSNRRCCQSCRFRKCQSIGMQIEWVMTESDRMTLLKNRLAKTRQVQVEKEKEELYGDLPRNLDPDNAMEINKLLDTMHTAFSSMPYPPECNGDNIDTLSNIFVFLCKRFGKFYFKVDDFNNICIEDRTYLLKNGIAMSLYINGAHMYDPVNESWPAECIHETVKVPRVTLNTLRELASIPEAFATVMKFYYRYESDLKDEVVSLMMYLISFFLPDDPNLLDSENVRKIQNKYIELLKRYLIARDGWHSVSGVFLKLMDGINYIKDILKFHAIVDIKPTVNHDEVTDTSVSFAQPMKNLITQIQEAFKGNFSQYASVFGSREKRELTGPEENQDNQVVKRSPATSVFGPSLRTDMIITSPFQSTMEWDMSKQESLQLCLEAPSVYISNNLDSQRDPAENQLERNTSSSGEDHDRNAFHTPSENLSLIRRRENRRNDMTEDVTVETVCDILKQLSHTEDKKVLRILKKNIPVELLQKFSQSLKDN
ncbi:uncharacterized protein LOC134782941 [Penaeus indicus]|uniref:uncharacterized protein LOC134782941 n=1 Tax=Penaeus indicus TaxID=29960 RepID=UPI00300C4036